MTGSDGIRDEDQWQDNDAPLETEQLALAGEEDRLPWLESAEDDDFEDEGGEGSGLLKLVLIGLVALAVIVGGIWWATNRGSDPTLVADGSLVLPEGGPYKEAPKDPGGKQFDGTGDSSFAVSEGQNRPAQLDGAAKDGGTAPAPAPAPAANADPAARPGINPASTGGVGVQVGAFSSRAAAEAGWTKLTGQAGGVLAGVPHRVIEGTADNGTVFRLQAVAPDAASASALCGKLKAASVPCQVK